VAIAALVSPGIAIASQPRPGISASERAKLLVYARREATFAGDRHPYDVEAVRTTGEEAEALGGAGGPPSLSPLPDVVGQPVAEYVVAMRGHFVCRPEKQTQPERPPLRACETPPGPPVHGTVITFSVLPGAPPPVVAGFEIGSRYPNLRLQGRQSGCRGRVPGGCAGVNHINRGPSSSAPPPTSCSGPPGGILGRAMPDEFTTSDPVELVLRFVEAANRRDFAAIEAFYAPDVVLRGAQIGTFEGRAAARGVLEDVIAPYEEFRAETEEVLDLGFGVAFAVVIAIGRVAGSSAEVRFRYASVTIWSGGLIERQTNYTDVDAARAAAERLAQEGTRQTSED